MEFAELEKLRGEFRRKIIEAIGIRVIPILFDFKKPWAVKNILITKKNYYCGFGELQVKSCSSTGYPDYHLPIPLLQGGLKLIKSFGTVEAKRPPAFVVFVRYTDCDLYVALRGANPAWTITSLKTEKYGDYQAYNVPIGDFKRLEKVDGQK